MNTTELVLTKKIQRLERVLNRLINELVDSEDTTMKSIGSYLSDEWNKD